MFCFQNSFTRASRLLVSPLSSAKSKEQRAEKEPGKTMFSTMKKSPCECKRRDSETSEDSIRFIDQEPSISEGSSVDTLPGVKSDYQEPDTLSPGPNAVAPSGQKLFSEGSPGINGKSSSRCRGSDPAEKLVSHGSENEVLSADGDGRSIGIVHLCSGAESKSADYNFRCRKASDIDFQPEAGLDSADAAEFPVVAVSPGETVAGENLDGGWPRQVFRVRLSDFDDSDEFSEVSSIVSDSEDSKSLTSTSLERNEKEKSKSSPNSETFEENAENAEPREESGSETGDRKREMFRRNGDFVGRNEEEEEKERIAYNEVNCDSSFELIRNNEAKDAGLKRERGKRGNFLCDTLHLCRNEAERAKEETDLHNVDSPISSPRILKNNMELDDENEDDFVVTREEEYEKCKLEIRHSSDTLEKKRCRNFLQNSWKQFQSLDLGKRREEDLMKQKLKEAVNESKLHDGEKGPRKFLESNLKLFEVPSSEKKNDDEEKVSPPFYSFLSVNAGGMRQESTSSPQLSNLLEETSPSSQKSPPGSRLESPGVNSLNPLDLMPNLAAARSCPNLERQNFSYSGSSSPNAAGPRFKPLEEGDIQVCYLNHTRTLVRKILSSKFLRRWETHHLYLNDACLSSKTPTGFFQHPVAYSSMSEVRKYAVARWDPTYKNCLSIVLPEGSLLLQAGNAYTRDQWYHSILWKKSIFRYQHLVSVNTKEEVMLRELRSMVEFALCTPLQDERISAAPLEAVAKLLEDSEIDETTEKTETESEKPTKDKSERRSWAEAVLSVAAPLLEKASLPPALARALAKLLTNQHPVSLALISSLSPAVTRCLKHTVDFGKAPDMRRLLQLFVAGLYDNNGEQGIREYIGSVHGTGSDCPHPRVLPNLFSICIAAIFHRFEVANQNLLEEKKSAYLPPLYCYLLVLNIASEYADWRAGLGALLQPVPFPEEALATKEVQESILLCVMRRLAKDPRCTVHRVLLPVREPRPGWIHIAAPSSSTCPDAGELFGEMLTTLLGCCCRRKRFIASLMEQAADDCILLAVRECDAAQEALCLMLEWRLLENEEARLQTVNALESTSSGKNRYAALCQRQRNLQELQQKGGPRKLTLPVRATDADVALLLGGRALGNLECLSLAFTSVTSACAEQLIKLPDLRYLNLWATQFGDAGLQMISEHLQKLQVLNLCETPVSDKGISTLASLTSLRKLNLNSTKLSAQTFESLKKRLPALQEFDVRYTEAW